MADSNQAEDFIRQFTCWASEQPDIQAVALVGSYARNSASETSDVDLVIITLEPNRYLRQGDWAAGFGSIIQQQIEDYGKLISLRVWYASGLEAEYGFTTPDWVKAPLDEGTRRVIMDGMRVLFERGPVLSPLRQYSENHPA